MPCALRRQQRCVDTQTMMRRSCEGSGVCARGPIPLIRLRCAGDHVAAAGAGRNPDSAELAWDGMHVGQRPSITSAPTMLSPR